MKNSVFAVLSMVLLLLSPIDVYGDEPKGGRAAGEGKIAPETLPQAASQGPVRVGGMTVDELRKALGVSFYIQGGYVFNTRNPRSQENDLRVFDHKANSFMLDLAQIRFQKEAEMGGLGFKFKLSAGETAKFIHSNGLGDASDSFDLTEAYVDYVAPLGKGLKITFGKFVTMHGAEVIEAADNMNYSRSFLFNYAIPFTHTGLKMYYPFSDKVNTALYVVNGWDNTSDNNRGKTAGVSFGLTPAEIVSLAFNFMYGPEQESTSKNDRFLFDWVGTVRATKNLTFVVNTDYATEQDALTAQGVKNTKWYGVAGYARYDFVPWFAVAVRGEYFKDPDGTRTGTAQTLKEVTFTPEFKVARSLIVRPEYRHDWSDKGVFGSTKKTQDTVSLGVMYQF